MVALFIVMFGASLLTPEHRGAPDPQAHAAPLPTIDTPPPPDPTLGNGMAETVLTRSPDGHFYADVMINGATVRGMIDTGASVVALTKQDAQKAGMQFDASQFTGTGKTAAGIVALKPVTIDRVALGPLEGHGVEGVIIDADMPVTLIGQSWLERVGHVTIEGDKMILR